MSTGTMDLRGTGIVDDVCRAGGARVVDLSLRVLYLVCDDESGCSEHLWKPGIINDDALFEAAARAGWTSPEGVVDRLALRHYCPAHPRGGVR